MTKRKTLTMTFAAITLAANTATANTEQSDCKQSSTCTQEKPIQLNKSKDNWFIGVGGGINTYYGNYTSQVPFGRRISPIFNIQAGKWFSPIIAFRGNFAWSNTISADVNTKNPLVYMKYKNAYKTKSDMISLSAETMFDVTNMFWGYNPKRAYSFIPYVGAGWIRNCENNADKIVTSIGLNNEFRLNDKFSLNLDIKASVFGEGLDMTKNTGKTSDMTTSIMLGATYHFKKRGFNKTQYGNSEIKHMQENLRNLNAEKAALEEELARAKQIEPEVKEVVKTYYTNSDVAIFFAINKSDLSIKEKVNLEFIAELIKKDTNSKFTITGYADKETGNATFNDKLSAARAQSVYDVLTNDFQVNASQLEIEHKGGVENMFYNDRKLSRVVIIKKK